MSATARAILAQVVRAIQAPAVMPIPALGDRPTPGRVGRVAGAPVVLATMALAARRMPVQAGRVTTDPVVPPMMAPEALPIPDRVALVTLALADLATRAQAAPVKTARPSANDS